MISIIATSSIIGLLVFFHTSLSAQSFADPDSALQGILKEMKGTSLSLHDARQHALKNATSVRKAEAAFLAAQGTVRRHAGSFDPEVFLGVQYEKQQLPAASFFAGASVLNTDQTNYSGGVRIDLPIGTHLELTANAVRLGTNSQFAFLNPEYDAIGSLRIRQPLLRGFMTSARKQLTYAEQLRDAEQARFDQEVRSTASQVDVGYWNLYAAERDYAVQKLSRDQAEAFLRETDLRAKAGLVGPNEVANAKTFLAQQELQLLDREEQFDARSDMFATLIGVRPDKEPGRFIPVDDPPINFPVEAADVLVAKILETNLALKALQKDVDASRTLVDAAKWEALPSVDLVGSISGNGLGGNPNAVVFGGDTLRTTRGGSLRDALTQAFNRDYPSWSIGVEISVPIGLRSGLGEEDRLEAQYISTQQRFTELSRSVEEQVRTFCREVSNGSRRLQAAKAGVEAAQEQVRIGWIEFRNGRTTAFELVRLGADFAAAQQRYSEALVRTAKAAASLTQLLSGDSAHEEQ